MVRRRTKLPPHNMGALASKAVRKAQRFNAENRAHRFLDQEKPMAAPKFESNLRDMEKVLIDNPDFMATMGKKSSDLDQRLKQVYVTSQDPKPHVPVRPGSEETIYDDNTIDDTLKSMPLDRKRVEDFEFGHKEPTRIPRGRTTLRHAIEFISNHLTEPEKWTVQRIADEYKLKESVVANVLDNFHTFEVFIPDTKKTESVLLHSPIKKLLADKPMDTSEQSFEEMDDHITKPLKQPDDKAKREPRKW